MLSFFGFRRSASKHATVRAFDSADVPRLVDIWTRAHAEYAGPVVQTPESWRWRVLERPGIEPADVAVAIDETGTVVGYAVVDAAGNVLEIAVDPAAAGPVCDAAATQLVGALEARCRARGGETIRFVLPSDDGAVQRALRQAGYWSEPSASFAGTIVDVAALLEVLLLPRLPTLPAGWAPTFRLELARGADWPCPQLVTRVEVGPPLVVSREPPGTSTPSVDCTIAVDLATLNRLFLGLETFEAALAGGTLAVRPATRTADAAAFLHLVTLGAPWYSPPADDR